MVVKPELIMKTKSKQVHKRRESIKKIKVLTRYFILTAIAFIMFYPLLWLIGASFKTNSEIFTSIGVLPPRIDFTSYIEGWKTSTEYTFTTYFINTFKYVIPRVVLTVISSVFTAYGFARFNFRYKKFLFALLIGTLFLPKIILRIPSYLLWKTFGMLDSFYPLFIDAGFAVDAFFVFMLIQFFRSIPRELDESAIVDGCNSFQTLVYILLPLLKPAIITVALFQFMWSMNDFMGPLIYISSVEKYPVAIALKMSMDTTAGVFAWNRVIAMSLLALVPSIVLFFSAQKHFVEGISTSGIKG
ncbi:MAG: carbohydrate ABC transporter permease [Bacillota bacterium]